MLYAQSDKVKCEEVTLMGVPCYNFVGPCIFTGKIETVCVPIEAVDRYNHGAYLQDAFSMLTAGQREWLKTGISDEGWEETFANSR